MKRGFVSDNCAAVHPAVMEAIAACNARGHMPSYGDDELTAKAQRAINTLFERSVATTFVYNGTGANVLSLACCLKPYESVVCADCAHINVDETGAPERILGAKLQTLPSADGKITPDQVVPLLLAQGNQHHCQPRVLSITNVTEYGAVYTPQEIRLLADFAHANEMLLHMDGARIANAVVACNCTMAEMTWKAGVDILSFGGCKNGLMFGEAVIFFDKSYARVTPFMRKNITQLHSKMRYIGAQYDALLSGSLWSENAKHANEMAKALQARIEKLPGIQVTHPAHANMMFVQMPARLASALAMEGFAASLSGLTRLVCSWDTQMEDIDAIESFICNFDI